MAEQQKWINDHKYVDKYQSTYGSTTKQLKVITQFFQDHNKLVDHFKYH